MDIDDGIQMINQIYEKQREERYFTLYATQYPNMDKDNFIQFEDYYKPHKQDEKIVEAKTSKEILASVKEMMDSNVWG